MSGQLTDVLRRCLTPLLFSTANLIQRIGLCKNEGVFLKIKIALKSGLLNR